MLVACRLGGLSALDVTMRSPTSAPNHHSSSTTYGAREETEMRPRVFYVACTPRDQVHVGWPTVCPADSPLI
jgi:hypothetical protein